MGIPVGLEDRGEFVGLRGEELVDEADGAGRKGGKKVSFQMRRLHFLAVLRNLPHEGQPCAISHRISLTSHVRNVD